MSQLSNAVLSYLANAVIFSTDRAVRSPRRNGEWLERILPQLSTADAHGIGEWDGIKERCVIVPAHSPTDWRGLAQAASQDAVLRIGPDGKVAHVWHWSPGVGPGFFRDPRPLYLRAEGRGGTVAEVPCGVLGLVPVRFRYAAAGER